MVVQASTRLNTVADLILQNADGTQMGFCGIDEVLSMLFGVFRQQLHGIPVLSVLSMYITGAWTHRSLLPFLVEEHSNRECLRLALRHRFVNLILTYVLSLGTN